MVRDYKLDFPDDPDFNAFLDEFQQESDRAAAVLAAAFLDDLLGILLHRSFVDDTRPVGTLLNWPGPLGNFAGKINVAYACGLITESERHDLDLVRDIRNDFAHSLHGLSFADQSLGDRCANFSVNAERFRALPDFTDEYPQVPRRLFDLAVALLAWYLRRRGAAAERFTVADPPLWPRREAGDG